MAKNKIVNQDYIAQLSIRLLERWGGHPLIPDGKNSSDRQLYRVPSETEIAERAVGVATEVVLLLYQRGHLEDEA